MEKYTFAVTGATGFIGKNLVDQLLVSGQNVAILSRQYVSPQNNLRVFRGTITSKKDVRDFIRSSNPDFFIHLAGHTNTKDYNNWENIFDVNINGTINVLNELKKNKNIKGIVIASSDRSHLDSTSLYGSSKKIIEHLSMTYIKNFKMPIVITKFCNVYGYGDNNVDRIIPKVIYSNKNNSAIELLRGGLDFRRYVHVNDVVSSIAVALEHCLSKTYPYMFNVYSEDCVSNLDLLELMQPHLYQKINYKLLDDQTKKKIYRKDTGSSLYGWKQKEKILNSLPKIIKRYLRDVDS
jgi:nucleoside-diphosphate-sugar epimerase